jgi:hypothetical protein
VFGVGTIDARDPAHAELATPTGGKPPKPKTGAPHADPIRVQQALVGCVPDLDRAVAVLMQRLDVDTGADAFAAFLQSWRNGNESFYEALDRTAGTKDSVFFFDVMLDDFRGQFGGARGELSVRDGLAAAHDALHAGFLSYRQYRGFREAVAWSLVLPPAVPLPARLQRYETKVGGAYSLRQQVVMVSAALDHDLAKVLAAITTTAPPLPKPIWSVAYDPYAAWNAKFVELQQTMIDRAGSTDAFLARALVDRLTLATAIAEASKKAIADAGTLGAKPH